MMQMQSFKIQLIHYIIDFLNSCLQMSDSEDQNCFCSQPS